MLRFILSILISLNMAALFAQKQPNVIVFFADDLRSDALGCYGNTHIKTPTIDSLAQHGTRFTNTYIQGSPHGALCAPSRAMLLTGKSYHRIHDKMQGHVTLAKTLQNQGYITYITGKWHNEKEVVADGFNYAKNVMFGGMSNHYQVYCQDLLPDGTFTDVRYKGFSTDIFTDTTIDFINTHDTNKPFFIYLPYTAPHDPRSPLPEYAALYKEANIPVPPNFMPYHPFYFGHNMDVRDEHLAPFPRTTKVISEQWADYAGLITHMDASMKKILDALKQRQLDENTLVVFLSDNGLAMGSHGLVGKQSTYEHCMNVPMIFSGPGLQKNATSNAFVYTLDVFPTLCELLNIDAPEQIDGQSFKQILKTQNDVHRSSIFLSYKEHHRAIRVGDFKLIRYPYIDKTVLYNLKTDPYELQDLSQLPKLKGTITQLLDELRKQQIVFADNAPLNVEKTYPLKWDYNSIQRNPDKWQPRYVIDKYFKE
ncbi:MAG: sulfatase-like hydrolase/transferase [Aestuariibaculum sp.]